MPNPSLAPNYRMSGITTRSRRVRVPNEGPPRGRSRRGCWTCRIRRKKCDERRNPENNCQSCVRLGIECLGWDENRPEWFKDTERLQAFKKTIKDRTSARTRGSESSLASFIASSAPLPPPAGSVRPNQPHSVTRPTPSSLLPNPISILELNSYPSVPFLSLPPSLLRPASPFSQECFNYRFFIENAQKLANKTELPGHCRDGVRDTTLLGRWKQDELDRGRLSNRELARRARAIEEKLNTEYEALSEQMVNHPSQSQLEEDDLFEFFTWDEAVDQADSPFSDQWWVGGPGISSSPRSPPTQEEPPRSQALVGGTGPVQTAASCRDLPFSLPYLTTLLYLYAILSGLNHRVPEISSTSERILNILSHKESHRGIPGSQLLFAAALVACLSESKIAQSIFSELNGNCDDFLAQECATALAEKP
ncbi:hypothetical protein CPB86DRAFT_579638 [Serendipita vermifera]|nr:hypothetical protein CPB86DRAFT_579638 [Serendipita vermifera]